MDILRTVAAEALHELQNFGTQIWQLAKQYPATAIGSIVGAGFILLVYMLTRDTLRWQFKRL
jgi:hypothetical protein